MNVLSIIVIPKSSHYNSDYLYTLYTKKNNYYSYQYYISYYIYELEEDLSSPRKTSVAILVFAVILAFTHGVKFFIFIITYNCSYNLDGINYTGIPAIPIVFINWCMAISIIPKLAKIREDKLTIEMTNGLRSDVIWVIIFYSFSYIFIFFQCCLLEIWDKICKNNSSPSPNTYVTTYQIRNYDPSPSRNITTNRNITLRSEIIQIRTTNNSLRNVLPTQIYENLKYFIEQGEMKTKALIEFFINMKFDGLTTDESITNELISIIIGVARALSDVCGDNIAKALLLAGTDEHLMLLMHYAFPVIVGVIKLKIEKGVYKKTYTNNNINLIHQLTQVERRIERDEEGNIKISFRVSRQINQASLIGRINQ